MALNFPNSPTLNEIISSGESSWIWDGTSWNSYSIPNWTLSGTEIYTTYNVGIGTTNPSTKLEVNGDVTASSFIKSGGTSSQFLKADGSIDSNTYLTTGDNGSSGFIVGISTINNQLSITSDDGTAGRLDLYCEVANAHYTRLQAAAHADYSGNVTVTLPVIDGTMIIGGSNSNTVDIKTTGDISANLFNLTQVTETVVNNFNSTLSPSAGTLTIDTSVGTVVLGDLNASVTTWAFTNVPTTNSKATTVTVIIDGDTADTYGDDCSVNGSAVSGGVKWSGGSAPTATDNFDIISFTIVKDSAGTINVFGSGNTNFS